MSQSYKGEVTGELQMLLGANKRKLREMVAASERQAATDDVHVEFEFEIHLDEKKVIEENYRDEFGEEPSNHVWKQIQDDIHEIQDDALEYLASKIFNGGKTERYSENSLFGICWVMWRNKKGLQYIKQNGIDKLFDLDKQGQTFAFRHVSDMGSKVINVQLRFVHFDLDREEIAKLKKGDLGVK